MYVTFALPPYTGLMLVYIDTSIHRYIDTLVKSYACFPLFAEFGDTHTHTHTRTRTRTRTRIRTCTHAHMHPHTHAHSLHILSHLTLPGGGSPAPLGLNGFFLFFFLHGESGGVCPQTRGNCSTD